MVDERSAVGAMRAWEDELKELHEFRVSGSTRIQELAKAIANSTLQNKRLYLSAIGANANFVAIKALGHAQGVTATRGRIIYVVPSFDRKRVEDEREEKGFVDLAALHLRVGSLPST